MAQLLYINLTLITVEVENKKKWKQWQKYKSDKQETMNAVMMTVDATTFSTIR